MQDVEAQVGEGVAEVAGVVRRHAAHVQADRPVADGRERHLLAPAGVEQAEGHAADSRGRPKRGAGPPE